MTAAVWFDQFAWVALCREKDIAAQGGSPAEAVKSLRTVVAATEKIGAMPQTPATPSTAWPAHAEVVTL